MGSFLHCVTSGNPHNLSVPPVAQVLHMFLERRRYNLCKSLEETLSKRSTNTGVLTKPLQTTVGPSSGSSPVARPRPWAPAPGTSLEFSLPRLVHQSVSVLQSPLFLPIFKNLSVDLFAPSQRRSSKISNPALGHR